jgi:hypothetical protein
MPLPIPSGREREAGTRYNGLAARDAGPEWVVAHNTNLTAVSLVLTSTLEVGVTPIFRHRKIYLAAVLQSVPVGALIRFTLSLSRAGAVISARQFVYQGTENVAGLLALGISSQRMTAPPFSVTSSPSPIESQNFPAAPDVLLWPIRDADGNLYQYVTLAPIVTLCECDKVTLKVEGTYTSVTDGPQLISTLQVHSTLA